MEPDKNGFTESENPEETSTINNIVEQVVVEKKDRPNVGGGKLSILLVYIFIYIYA